MLQDHRTDTNENAYFAAMVYLVVRSRYYNDQNIAGAHTGVVRIRDIMLGTDTTVFQFFKAMTKMLELAPREPWLTERLPNLQRFIDEFKQVEVKFMFAYMLYEKLKKVSSPFCLFAKQACAP